MKHVFAICSDLANNRCRYSCYISSEKIICAKNVLIIPHVSFCGQLLPFELFDEHEAFHSISDKLTILDATSVKITCRKLFLDFLMFPGSLSHRFCTFSFLVFQGSDLLGISLYQSYSELVTLQIFCFNDLVISSDKLISFIHSIFKIFVHLLLRGSARHARAGVNHTIWEKLKQLNL